MLELKLTRWKLICLPLGRVQSPITSQTSGKLYPRSRVLDRKSDRHAVRIFRWLLILEMLKCFIIMITQIMFISSSTKRTAVVLHVTR